MADITFSIDKIRDDARILEMVRLQHAELTRRGMPNNNMLKDPSIYQYASLDVNGEPLTALMFAPIPRDENPVVYITGSYTRPSWRRLGLYSALVRLCVNEWRLEDQYDWLLSGYHRKNWISEAMQAKHHREAYESTETHVRTRLSLRPQGDEFQVSPESLRPILEMVERLS